MNENSEDSVQSPSKFNVTFMGEKGILKSMQKHKIPWIIKAALRGKETDFKLDFRAIGTKTAQYWHKTPQSNETEDPMLALATTATL